MHFSWLTVVSAIEIIVATAIEKICWIWTHHRPEVQY